MLAETISGDIYFILIFTLLEIYLTYKAPVEKSNTFNMFQFL